MKKAWPWIILAVLVIIIVVVIQRSKKQAVDQVIDQQLTPTIYPGPHPTSTPISPVGALHPSITPPTIPGASMTGPDCINNSIITSMINAWKTQGLIKRIAIKQELKATCPAALYHLVR